MYWKTITLLTSMYILQMSYFYTTPFTLSFSENRTILSFYWQIPYITIQNKQLPCFPLALAHIISRQKIGGKELFFCTGMGMLSFTDSPPSSLLWFLPLTPLLVPGGFPLACLLASPFSGASSNMEPGEEMLDCFLWAPGDLRGILSRKWKMYWRKNTRNWDTEKDPSSSPSLSSSLGVL